MGAYTRWRALRPEHRLPTVNAAVRVAAAAAAVRLLGIERALRLAAPPVRGTMTSGTTGIGDVVAAVERAGRYVPGSTCLSTAMALAWILRGRGREATVRVGVKVAGGFAAHAWVECDGVAVNGPSGQADGFAAITSSARLAGPGPANRTP